MSQVLWAHKIGDEDYVENIITETDDTEHLKAAAVWAVANGFTRLRIQELDLTTPPDFTKTLNI